MTHDPAQECLPGKDGLFVCVKHRNPVLGWMRLAVCCCLSAVQSSVEEEETGITHSCVNLYFVAQVIVTELYFVAL